MRKKINKKLTLYMIDGTEYGPRLGEIGNWVGKAIYSPRASVSKIISRDEFDNPGIYCLKGVYKKIKMKYKILFITFILCIGFVNLNAQSIEQIVIGEKYHINSDLLSEEREYWVSLPNSYTDEFNSYKRYPILILLDGNTHFSFASGIVNSMSSGNTDKREIPEMIVVGILNVNRERDFTPDKIVTKRENKTGGGDKFLSFIENELIPKLDSEFRTVPYRILVGHSLGGLITVHSYLQESSLFNSFISIDPSFGTWDENVMDEKLSNIQNEVLNRPLYIATANWGRRNLRNRDRHIRFFESLNSKTNNLNAYHKYYPSKNHSSVVLPAFYDGLNFIFKGYSKSYREVNDIEKFKNHYKELSINHSYEFKPPEELVNRIGYYLMRSNETNDKQEALKFFNLNAINYPQSFNVFDSLGEAYNNLGNEKEAIENFKKSLELNPDNENAQKMINKLKITDGNR